MNLNVHFTQLFGQNFPTGTSVDQVSPKRGWTAPFLHRRDAQSGLALQLCEVPWDVGRDMGRDVGRDVGSQKRSL